MKIEEITKIEFEAITTDDGDYHRYSSDNWRQRIGESIEPLFDCDEIEKLYQEFINTEVEEEIIEVEQPKVKIMWCHNESIEKISLKLGYKYHKVTDYIFENNKLMFDLDHLITFIRKDTCSEEECFTKFNENINRYIKTMEYYNYDVIFAYNEILVEKALELIKDDMYFELVSIPNE